MQKGSFPCCNVRATAFGYCLEFEYEATAPFVGFASAGHTAAVHVAWFRFQESVEAPGPPATSTLQGANLCWRWASIVQTNLALIC
jgi:hypothetical protein